MVLASLKIILEFMKNADKPTNIFAPLITDKTISGCEILSAFKSLKKTYLARGFKIVTFTFSEIWDR